MLGIHLIITCFNVSLSSYFNTLRFLRSSWYQSSNYTSNSFPFLGNFNCNHVIYRISILIHLSLHCLCHTNQPVWAYKCIMAHQGWKWLCIWLLLIYITIESNLYKIILFNIRQKHNHFHSLSKKLCLSCKKEEW